VSCSLVISRNRQNTTELDPVTLSNSSRNSCASWKLLSVVIARIKAKDKEKKRVWVFQKRASSKVLQPKNWNDDRPKERVFFDDCCASRRQTSSKEGNSRKINNIVIILKGISWSSIVEENVCGKWKKGVNFWKCNKVFECYFDVHGLKYFFAILERRLVPLLCGWEAITLQIEWTQSFQRANSQQKNERKIWIHSISWDLNRKSAFVCKEFGVISSRRGKWDGVMKNTKKIPSSCHWSGPLSIAPFCILRWYLVPAVTFFLSVTNYKFCWSSKGIWPSDLL